MISIEECERILEMDLTQDQIKEIREALYVLCGDVISEYFGGTYERS